MKAAEEGKKGRKKEKNEGESIQAIRCVCPARLGLSPPTFFHPPRGRGAQSQPAPVSRGILYSTVRYRCHVD